MDDCGLMWCAVDGRTSIVGHIYTVERRSAERMQQKQWNNKQEAFARFNKNGDGNMTKDEFSSLCSALFINEDNCSFSIDDDQLTSIFDVFDKDGDGLICKEEFDFCWEKWVKTIVKPTSALLIVDVQNDFISGTMAIHNCNSGTTGSDVVTPINRLLEKVPFEMVAYSMDWHPHDHVSFIDNIHLRELHPSSSVAAKDAKVLDTVVFLGPPVMEQKLWPSHGVKETWGSELHKDLKIVEDAVIVHKGTDPEIDSYSAFWDNLGKEQTSLHAELQKRRITDLFVCGLAYDYCVGGSCLDALKLGFRTVVVDDCTAGIQEIGVKRMKDNFIKGFGVIARTNEILAMAEGRDRRFELGYKLALELKRT